MNITTINMEPAQIRYQQQLTDQRWLQLRQSILQRDGKSCRHCGTSHRLQVHHRQYHVHAATGEWQAPWAYCNKLLITLCERCHKRGHSMYSIPVFTIK